MRNLENSYKVSTCLRQIDKEIDRHLDFRKISKDRKEVSYKPKMFDRSSDNYLRNA